MATAIYNNQEVVIIRKGPKTTRIKLPDGAVKSVETSALLLEEQDLPENPVEEDSKEDLEETSEEVVVENSNVFLDEEPNNSPSMKRRGVRLVQEPLITGLRSGPRRYPRT